MRPLPLRLCANADRVKQAATTKTTSILFSSSCSLSFLDLIFAFFWRISVQGGANETNLTRYAYFVCFLFASKRPDIFPTLGIPDRSLPERTM
jgi:hypothetical protein